MVIRVGRRDCWYWGALRTRDGYGCFGVKTGVTVRAHRYAYETLVGPIGSSLVLDHLCRIRFCVNPAHLDPVTPRENVLRGRGLAARNARVTRCPLGHRYTSTNTRKYGRGGRHCRRCSNAASADYRSRNDTLVRLKARARYFLRVGRGIPRDLREALRGVRWKYARAVATASVRRTGKRTSPPHLKRSSSPRRTGVINRAA